MLLQRNFSRRPGESTMKFHFFFCRFEKLLHNSLQTIRVDTNSAAMISTILVKPCCVTVSQTNVQRNTSSLRCSQKRMNYWILMAAGTAWCSSPIYRYKWRIGPKKTQFQISIVQNWHACDSFYVFDFDLSVPFDRSFSRSCRTYPLSLVCC